MAARTAADGEWVRRTARTAADGVGATEWLEMGGEKKPLVMSDLGCADGCGRQMGAENCDGCGRQKWVRRTCARTAGRLGGRRGCNGVAGNGWGEEAAGDERPGCADGCNGVAGNGWGEEAAGDERPWLRGRLRTGKMGAENCVDGCGRRGCNWKWVAGNGWGEEAAGDERPWLRGRLRTANGCGELRGRLRTAWVQGGGWKWVGRRSRW